MPADPLVDRWTTQLAALNSMMDVIKVTGADLAEQHRDLLAAYFELRDKVLALEKDRNEWQQLAESTAGEWREQKALASTLAERVARYENGATGAAFRG